MRKSAIFGAAIAALGLTTATNAATFTGNGAGGFGGGVGNSTLSVTDAGTAFQFSLNSSGFNGNVLVLYVDSVAGGVNDTSTLADTADGGRTAISGLNNTAGPGGTPARTLATFAPGFGADYAITLEPGVFSGIFNLATPTNFGYQGSGGLDTGLTGAATYVISVPKAAIGLADSATAFSFEGTLISGSGYRSNETIGTSVTTPDPTNPGTAPNAGFSGTQVFGTANAVPEPASLAVLGLGAAGLLRRRK